MNCLEYENFLSEATDYLRSRSDQANAQFDVGRLPRYDCDLSRGEIWWNDVDAPKVRARITLVGSISTVSNTWLWSWANSHFADVPLGDIELVRKFGEVESIAKLTEPKWKADEVDGWEMTAIAARLLEAQGAYRPPGKNGFLFLLYDRLEPIPEAERGRYLPQTESSE